MVTTTAPKRIDNEDLAGLTRPVGVLLAIPAVVEGWQHRELYFSTDANIKA